jgi:urease subunit beta
MTRWTSTARRRAASAVRFEPGQMRHVTLVKIAGDRIIHGFGGKIAGPLGD